MPKIEMIVEEEVQSNEPVAVILTCDCPDCPDCNENYPCQAHGCKCQMCCNDNGHGA